ncbi:MAG: hypothetical protein IJ738_03365 [Alphaproteobacteria bacterium]|nr:hypothetical protein [Alphaproteobacteria bacterium]
MEKRIFCALLSVIAATGLGLSVWLEPEMFTTENCFSLFFVVEVFAFFPLGLVPVDEKERLLLISILWAAIGMELGILLGATFWFLPATAAVLPCLYFMFYSWFSAIDLSITKLANNAFLLIILAYAMCAFVKFICAPVIRAIFN